MSENIKPAYYIYSYSLIYNAAMSLNETKQEELQDKKRIYRRGIRECSGTCILFIALGNSKSKTQ